MKTKLIAFLFLTSLILVFSCRKKVQPRSFDLVKIDSIGIDSSSIRALLSLKDSTAIFATSDGYIGLASSVNSVTKLSQQRYDTLIPHFRAIASNGTNAFTMSVGNPALLYKFEEGQAKLVYKEEHPKVFYDAMAFFDKQHGIAMGDPTEECLSIILTNDGGESWMKVPCTNLPETVPGEAAFAASNSNIALVGKQAWLVTGGANARVFFTPDMGLSWEVYDTPIISGQNMTGIYSVDFFDSNRGIIFGGNWEDKAYNKSNKAITEDGGKTWQLVANGEEPGYKSCVQYVPGTQGKELFAVGSTGVSFSNDGGYHWKEVSKEGYYTISFVNKNIAWLAGKNKIGKLNLH